MDLPIHLLTQFGFTEQEADLYITCLKLGKPTVAEMARRSKKNRTAVYFHLKHLLEKEVVQEVKDGKKTRFVPVEPEELARRFDRLTTDFKSVVPGLAALSAIDKEAPQIQILESRAGYMRMYDEVSSLPRNDTFFVVEGKDALRQELSILTQKEWQVFFSRIVERGIVTQGLFTEESLHLPQKHLSKQNLSLLRERIWNIRALPESVLPLKQLFFIYGNTVAFLFPETSLVILVRHAGLASVQRAVFDGLFHFAKPHNVTFLN